MTEVMKQSRSRPGGKGAVWRSGVSVMVALLTAWSLTACSTVTDLYRDVSGSSKEDPPPDTQNTAGMQQATKQDYPNLGSVPETPTRGLTQTQREQLAQGLIADRNNAHYTADRLASGDNSATMPTPSALPEDPAATTGALPGGAESQIASAPESKALPEGPTAASPSAAIPDANAPAPQLSGPGEAIASHPAPAGSNELAGGGMLASGGTESTTRPADSKSKRRNRHKKAEDAQASAPVPRENPVPQTPEEPPPTPSLPPVPPPQPAADGSANQLASGGLLAEGTQIANAPVPSEPPATPNMAESPPAPAPVAANSGTKRNQSERFAVDFAQGSNELSAIGAKSLETVPALHSQHGGLIRVVSHAEIPTGGEDPAGAALASYQTALARSQIVKQSLIDHGVPAGQVISEVSTKEPVSNRVDVIVEY